MKWENEAIFPTREAERGQLPSRSSAYNLQATHAYLWPGFGVCGRGSGRGRGLGGLAQWEPGGGALLPALSSTRILLLLAVPSTPRVPQRSPTPAHPQPTRPACGPLLLFPDLSPRPSGLDIMGDGGEGEDEVQFLRTVRISVLGVSGTISRGPLSVSLSRDVSVLIAGSLGVYSSVPLGGCHSLSFFVSPARTPFSS